MRTSNRSPSTASSTANPSSRPEKFWGKQAKEELVWFKPWTKVLQWEEPFAKWFVGGQLNVSHNCLDRHLGTATRQQGRADLGGRARRPRQAGRGTHAHLQAASSRGLPLRQCPQAQRHQAGRPRPHLPADGARGRHRHARLRPHRRGALGGLRRLQRAIRRRPHPGFAGQAGHHGRRRLPPRRRRAAQAECGRGAHAQGRRRANCWPRPSRRSSCCAAPTTRCSSRRAAISGGTRSWSTWMRIARRRRWTARRRCSFSTPAVRPANPRASCTPPAATCSTPS